MLDPRSLRALLKLAQEYRGSFTELDLEHDGLKLHVRYGAGQAQEQARSAPRMTRAELEVEARKRNEKLIRPALESLSEKPPLFNWGGE